MSPLPVTPEELRARAHGQPPADWPAPLRTLWLIATGDWQAAHEIAQELDDADGAWLHAHLHRIEGDLGNADYWYARAGLRPRRDALAGEWLAMAEVMLPATRR